MLRLLLLSLFVLTSAHPLAAQTALRLNQPIDRTLGPEDAHAYTLDLPAAQFVLGHAVQHSVDVVVTLTGPDGAQLDAFDEPARGPEPFQFRTDAAGTYTLTVAPFEGAEGRYTITLDRSEPAATTPEGIVRQQFAVLDREGSPGAVVAVIRRGDIAFAEAFGMANLAHGVPYTLETPTNIGSTSKQFTAMALLLLQDEGALSLDDDVRLYVPELPDFGETVTLRHLLTHTSGYREFLNLLAIGGWQQGDQIWRKTLVETVQRQPELQASPGAEWSYSNTGYGLAAMVVERVTGEPFPAWMQANVFEPLGMTRSYVRADPGQIIPGRAEGYTMADDGAWRETRDLAAAPGAGAVYTTAQDLARWMDNYRTGALGGEAAVGAMTTPYVLAGGDTTEYGLGLQLDEYRGLRRVRHGGADFAHRSQFWYFPEIEAGLVIHTNSPAMGGSIDDVAGAFFERHLAPATEQTADPSDFEPDAFDPETFDAYAGRYALDAAPAFVLAFRRDGDAFYTQATGQPEFPIFPVAENRFELRVVEAEVEFHVEDDGSVERITLHQGGANPATRIHEDVEEVNLADYAGRYFSEEVEAFYTVSLEDGALVLTNRRMEGPIAIAHGSVDHFTGGFPIVTVDFERDASGAVTGFQVGNGRVRGVQFERVSD